jgi:hypothetical protein
VTTTLCLESILILVCQYRPHLSPMAATRKDNALACSDDEFVSRLAPKRASDTPCVSTAPRVLTAAPWRSTRRVAPQEEHDAVRQCTGGPCDLSVTSIQAVNHHRHRVTRAQELLNAPCFSGSRAVSPTHTPPEVDTKARMPTLDTRNDNDAPSPSSLESANETGTSIVASATLPPPRPIDDPPMTPPSVPDDTPVIYFVD